MIPIKNIYYMLAYSFNVLQEQGYRKLATEDFHNTAELCAAILAKGLAVQIKRGLGREYIQKSETLSTLQGKLDISESIKAQTMLKKQMVCSFDDFSVNTEMNRIIKSTVQLLLKANIDKARKKALRSLMIFFSDVEPIDLRAVNWVRQYNNNNQTYQMLIAICHMVYKGMLQNQQDGNNKLMDFTEKNMPKLYEKFILEYYRKEHPELTANASQIAWQLDDDFDEMLPKMQSDIMLNKGNAVLIVDAKYYGNMTREHYGVHTIHSNNLYQIFTYVKNKEFELRDSEHQVFGMLLYAKTDEEIAPDGVYQMSGNQVTVKSLDLNCDFNIIREQLESIVNSHFALHSRN